jgi:hypothetical protein
MLTFRVYGTRVLTRRDEIGFQSVETFSIIKGLIRLDVFVTRDNIFVNMKWILCNIMDKRPEECLYGHWTKLIFLVGYKMTCGDKYQTDTYDRHARPYAFVLLFASVPCGLYSSKNSVKRWKSTAIVSFNDGKRC